MKIRRGYFLDVDNTNQFRALCAMAILFHHMSQRGFDNLFYVIFNRIGCLIVAIFFFLSGYGLYCSHSSSGEKFKKGFGKRLVRLIIPFVITLILQAVTKYYIGTYKGIRYRFEEWKYGRTLGVWYVYELIFIYFIFYVIFCCVKINKKYQIILNFCIIIILCGSLAFLGWQEWWYNACLAFPIGVCFAYKRSILIERLESIGKCGLCSSLLALIYCCLRYVNTNFTGGVQFITEIMAPTMFACCVICFFYNFTLYSKILKILGRISYEIFLSQFIFLDLFRCEKIYIKSGVTYILVVCICTVCLAMTLHKIDYLIMCGTIDSKLKNKEVDKRNGK